MGLKISGLALIVLLLVASIGVTDGVNVLRPEKSSSGSSSGSVAVSAAGKKVQADAESAVDATQAGKLVRRLIGSSAPECGHSCGACSPCIIQVVSFECSEAMEPHAEACPVGYLCICHGRAFPIP